MAEAIVLRHVTKTFGDKTAVRDLDLVVPQGALYGIIGPNGAGKTTIIRIIMSILFADRGERAVLGQRSALEAKDRIGYLPEERGVYKKMKVGDFLAYMARLKGGRGPTWSGACASGSSGVDLGGVERKRCDELSKGMQQKVQFLAAIFHEPDLLILDEPFSGLDPVNLRLLRDLVREQHERGATVLFSTHVMTQAEQLCEHIVMIHDGSKVLDDNLAAIRNSIPRERRCGSSRSIRMPTWRGSAGCRSIRKSSARAAGLDTLALADGGRPGGGHARRARSPAAGAHRAAPAHLEDVFVDIVTGGRGGCEEAAPAACRAARRRRRRAGGARVKKILYVAQREFLATVATKGFLIGMLVTPAHHRHDDLRHAAPHEGREPAQSRARSPWWTRPGRWPPGVRAYLAPEAHGGAARGGVARGRRGHAAEELGRRRPQSRRPGRRCSKRSERARRGAEARRHERSAAGADLERGEGTAPGRPPRAAGAARLALVVVHPDAVVRAPGSDRFGSYDLFVRAKLDDRLERRDQGRPAARHRGRAGRASGSRPRARSSR